MKKQATKKIKVEEAKVADVVQHIAENLECAVDAQLHKAGDNADSAAQVALEKKIKETEAQVRAKVTAKLGPQAEEAKKTQQEIDDTIKEVKKAQQETKQAINDGMEVARAVGDVLGVDVPDQANVVEGVANQVLGQDIPTTQEVGQAAAQAAGQAALEVLPQPPEITAALSGNTTPGRLLEGGKDSQPGLMANAKGVLANLGCRCTCFSFLPCCRPKAPQVQPAESAPK